ncbi:hypothetical protein GTR02_08615 [Kineococcus sp. R8]|uniref:hypothetical protein n=1 Tax=Kineococcus siccus TaxID=2696567 RepID=UPI0014131870|nr:hypothetical protein [Kineococcus siccus]NAZ81880.1 hypothetical protein [Kineococcus siccus]
MPAWERARAADGSDASTDLPRARDAWSALTAVVETTAGGRRHSPAAGRLPDLLHERAISALMTATVGDRHTLTDEGVDMSSQESFFPTPSDAVTADDPGDAPFATPVWAAPPPDLIPGVADLSIELGRSPDTVVLVEGARAYPQGVELRLVVRFRETHRRAGRDLIERLNLHHGRGSLDLLLPAGGLRWGVQFSDGQKVTSMDESPWAAGVPDGVSPADWLVDHPVMDSLTRPSNSMDAWTRDIWLWPLPPPGPLRLVCSWPDRGIEETAVEVDAAVLRDAAERSRPLGL